MSAQVGRRGSHGRALLRVLAALPLVAVWILAVRHAGHRFAEMTEGAEE